ncbi:MAG: hypothetical protein ACTSXU_03535 [Promethearchaeota archaeon]
MRTKEDLIDQIASTLVRESRISKYAFFKDDGTVVKSTLSEENTEKMGKIVKFYSRKMQVNNYFNQISRGVNFLLHRLSESIFLAFLSTADLDYLISLLYKLFKHYSKDLDKSFHEVPDSFKKIVKYIVISQGLEMGPEPVAVYPDDMPSEIKLKISMKSMLLLTAEREGAVRGIPATLPFIEYYAMGVIFLFDIPNREARGGAYDTCISILVDESYRPAIYENMFLLENACIDAANLIRNGVSLKRVIDFLLSELDHINLKPMVSGKAYEIEQLMKSQLKKITESLNNK